MQYALFGDIHSSKEDLEKVLADISEKLPKQYLLVRAIYLNVRLVKKTLRIKNLADLKML